MDIIKLLVKHGADIHSIDMAWVFDAWDPKIIEYFIEQGADVETGRPLASALCWRIRTALGVYKRHKDHFPSFQEKSLPLPQNVFPMLFMPFLNERQLKELERVGISGIDLCGNCVVVSPGTFSVFRSGAKNRFPSSAAIKNIYRKNSSMVGRGFFVYPDFQTVQDILAAINQRNLLVNRWNKKPMSISTVSKVLKTMVEDLIITRTETIRLLQPDKLLEKLRENYNPPAVKERIRLKIPGNNKSILKLLSEQSQQMELPLIAPVTSSVTRYTVMQRGDLLTVYCPKVEMLLKRLPGSQSDRFPNLEL